MSHQDFSAGAIFGAVIVAAESFMTGEVWLSVAGITLGTVVYGYLIRPVFAEGEA